MYKLSIAVAIYNAEETVERCLDSIFMQNYPNMEVILVNDGSTDRSEEICLAYQKKYGDKVIYQFQENQGLGGARDTGVALASGDYLFFMDSDDYIDKNTVSECMDFLNKNDVDILFFEYEMVTESCEHIKNVKSPHGFDGIKTVKEKPSVLLLQAMDWNKIYRRALLVDNHIAHPRRAWYEDLRTSLKAVVNADRIAYCDKPYYKYVIRNGSIMRNTTQERNREIFTAMDDILEYFKSKNLFERYYDELCYLAIDNVYITATIRLLRMGADNAFIDEFKVYLEQNFPDYKNNKYIKSMSAQYKLTYKLLEMHMRPVVKLLLKIKG